LEIFTPSFGQVVPSVGSRTCGVGVGVATGVGVGVATGVGVGSAGFNTGLIAGFAPAFVATPLFHANLFPDLMQVNFLPLTVEVAPAFVHLAPALTAAFEGAAVISVRETNMASTRRRRFIGKNYQFK
jgi:hypothetical protein